jgi:hypothetical protein
MVAPACNLVVFSGGFFIRIIFWGRLMSKRVAMAPPHAITCIYKGGIVIVQVLLSKVFHSL